MIGSWDYNGNKFENQDLNNGSATAIQDFINSKRGVLFGHDVVSQLNPIALNQFADDVNIQNKWIKATPFPEEIEVKKKGLLTNYPWNIGDVKDVLKIPMTHHQNQVAYGDVWMSFHGYGSASDDGKGEQNFYLTTWNNCAMIQTGHSRGRATPDEQKILANTLFYLAQVTEDTKWNDHKGQDLAAPDKPSITKVTKNTSENKTIISINSSKDNGSTYEYYVEGIGRIKNSDSDSNSNGNSNSEPIKSEIKSATITSGLKGYSIVIDQNEDTIPDKIVETTSTEYTIDNKFNEDFYVHVAAVDNAGNVSEVSTYKYEYPTLNLTAGDLNTDKNTVNIKAEAKVTDKTIKSITLPDGNVVEGSNAEFTVDVNGTYTFKAVDNEGNEVSRDIKISNIPGKITLDDVKVDEDKASTTLNWSISDKSQDYTYNVNSKKSDETEFKSQSVNGTAYVDSNAKDIAVPEKSEINSVVTDKENGTTSISFSESTDNGTNYDYYVDGTGINSGLSSKSETKSATVTSGIKGYSIVVDQNKDTVPDGTITTTSTDYTFDKVFDSDFYVHVAAVDNAGNMSEVSTFKYAYPVLKLTPSTTEIVKDTVTIKAEASCEGNSIVKIITPDGKEIDGDKAEYTVDVNGIYTFTAIDSKGDKVPQSIEIKNIVPDVILNVEPNMNKIHLEEQVVVDLTINHITNIGVVRLRIKYDSSKLEFLGFNKVTAIRYFLQKKDEDMILTLFAENVSDFVSEKSSMLKLNFKGIAPGDALIDITKGKVSSGLPLEKTLRDAECGQTTINICNRKLPTISLAYATEIIKYMGKDPEKVLPEFDADLNLDGKIDYEDLNKAYELMLQNPDEDL